MAPKLNFGPAEDWEDIEVYPLCSLCGSPDKEADAIDCDRCEEYYEEEVAKYIKAMQEAGEEYK